MYSWYQAGTSRARPPALGMESTTAFCVDAGTRAPTQTRRVAAPDTAEPPRPPPSRPDDQPPARTRALRRAERRAADTCLHAHARKVRNVRSMDAFLLNRSAASAAKIATEKRRIEIARSAPERGEIACYGEVESHAKRAVTPRTAMKVTRPWGYTLAMGLLVWAKTVGCSVAPYRASCSFPTWRRPETIS